MGCICSKESNAQHDYVSAENEKEKKKEVIVGVGIPNKSSQGSLLNSKSKITLQSNNVNCIAPRASVEENGKTRIVERPKNGGIQRGSAMDLGRVNGIQQTMSRVKAEQVAAGWPSWLASVAGEAIHGWAPRTPDSYEKINKIGQGTYSSVYRARDLTTDKIVAMKKVRFVNMDPESVRFMAREICILRRLDHPNVMKLEALVTSRISGNLYLVFEYMEHDLAGLLASPRVKFTEPQIKCYAQQMFLGLEHCHSRGVLHRDIKGSNLLVDNKGILKIGDFGLATSFEPDQKQPLTSHVVTLWYRAPELLLGETQYGVAVDMWSAGCIVAELFAGKPIMPGTTEVEQMHKIFKLCGSPTEEYWRKTKLPHTGSFKSQRMYKRRVADAFKDFPSSALTLVEVLLSIDPELRGSASSALKSEFFTSDPLPCDPSSLPKYRPSKEFDAKLREQEARRRRAASVRELGAEYVPSNSRKSKATLEEKGQSSNSSIEKYNPPEENGASFLNEQSRGNMKNGYSNSNTTMHPKAVGCSSTRIKLMDDDDDDAVHSILVRTLSSSESGIQQLTKQASQLHQIVIDSSNYHPKGADGMTNNGPTDYVPKAKRNRIFCSGPLVPTGGGNMEDMLKEHERQIQQVVRKARLHKSRTKD